MQTKRLWLNQSEYIDVPAQENGYLTREITSRARSVDFWGVLSYLPDPDPILRKLGKDATTYKTLLADSHVFACYDGVKRAVLASEFTLDYPGTDSERLFKSWLENFDLAELISQFLDAPFYGRVIAESVWDQGKLTWLPKRVQAKPVEWFVFDMEERLRFLSRESQIEGELLREKYKFLLCRNSPSYENPYGVACLSRCFWPVAFKKGGWKFWTILCEKFGVPRLIGKVPRGTQQPERDALAAYLEAMVLDAVLVINDDESVEPQDVSGKGQSGELFESLIKACNREVSKVILGHTLAIENEDTGTYAGTKGGLEVKGEVVEAYKKLTKKSVDQLF